MTCFHKFCEMTTLLRLGIGLDAIPYHTYHT